MALHIRVLLLAFIIYNGAKVWILKLYTTQNLSRSIPDYQGITFSDINAPDIATVLTSHAREVDALFLAESEHK